MFIKGKTLEKKLIMIKFIKNIHVVDNLKVNLLIKINILEFKEVIIDLFKKKHNLHEMLKSIDVNIIYNMR